jgi:hypothetical protein
MGSKRQRGLFDFEDRMREIGKRDPLARLHDVVDWEAFRGPIEKAVVPEPKGPGGRPRFRSISNATFGRSTRVIHVKVPVTKGNRRSALHRHRRR